MRRCGFTLCPAGERLPENYRAPSQATSDTIASLCANDTILLVGRASGVVTRYRYTTGQTNKQVSGSY